MDTSERSHRRAVWATIAVVLLILVGVAAYEANWIHQRRGAWAEWAQWAESREWPTTTTLPELPTQAQNLPARGAGPLDKLAMWLSGEPQRDSFAAYHSGNDATLATFAICLFDDDVLEGLDTVQHARWLFPEAEIAVEYYSHGMPNRVTAWNEAHKLLSSEPPAIEPAAGAP